MKGVHVHRHYFEFSKCRTCWSFRYSKEMVILESDVGNIWLSGLNVFYGEDMRVASDRFRRNLFKEILSC